MATTINLLPWREAYREEQRRQFFSTLVLTVILAMLCGLLWINVVSSKVSAQESRNALYQTEIDRLKVRSGKIRYLKKQKVDMLARMKIINGLQVNRAEVVSVFEQLVRATPKGVYLIGMNLEGSLIRFQGKSVANKDISEFMRRLDQSGQFEGANVTSVKADTELSEQGSLFDMTVRVKPLWSSPNMSK